MSSVLAAVRGCIGVPVDVPEGLAGERTFTRLGPAPAPEVLEALLSSTEYNYVIEMSETEPGKIHGVLLMGPAEGRDAQTATGKADLVLTPARRVWLDMRRAARPAEVTGQDPGPAEPEVPLSTPAQKPETASSEKISDDKAAEGAGKAPAATEAPTNSPASPPQDAADATSASKEMQNKITSMEQLFEQRKKMLENQGATDKPQ